MGRTLGFFESFPFSRVGSRLWAFVGPVVLTGVLRVRSDLSTPIWVSLIVVPDSKEHNENEHNEQVGCQLDVQHQDHSVSISIHAKSIPSNLKPNLLLYNLKSIFSRIHINLMYVVYC